MNKLEYLNCDNVLKSLRVPAAEKTGYEYREGDFDKTWGGEWVLTQAEALILDYIVLDNLKMTLDKLISAKSKMVALAWMIVCAANRSDVLGKGIKQTDRPGLSAGVPGIMGIAKRYNNVPYSSWDLNKPENRDYLGRTMPKNIGRVLYTYYGKFEENFSKFGKEGLLLLRQSCVDGHRIKKSGNIRFDELQQYFRFMLVQGWIWGSEYSSLMIYNTDDLDAAPPDIGLVKLGQKDPFIESYEKGELEAIR